MGSTPVTSNAPLPSSGVVVPCTEPETAGPGSGVPDRRVLDRGVLVARGVRVARGVLVALGVRVARCARRPDCSVRSHRRFHGQRADQEGDSDPTEHDSLLALYGLGRALWLGLAKVIPIIR